MSLEFAFARSCAGSIYGLGFCPRWGKVYKCSTKAHMTKAHSILTEILRGVPPLVADLPQAAAQSECPDPANGPNFYLSRNYTPCEPAPDAPHPPPIQIVSAGVAPGPACNVLCDTCRLKGCDRCKACPIHYDQRDRSWTVGVLHQRFKASFAQRSYFVLGNEVFPLKGGIAVAFDGRTVPHGVWAPAVSPEAKAAEPFHGIVCVKR